MKIIVAGYGFVGKAVSTSLKTEHEVIIVDPKYTTEQVADHRDADGIIICVNAPTAPEGFVMVRDIVDVLSQVPSFMPILLKSTVTPDVLNELYSLYPNHSITYSPEFLRAATAVEDFKNQKFVILGGEDPEGFWQDVLSKVLQCKMFFYCSPVEASMVKYSINSFLASKVAFFNQIYDLCGKNGADYDLVRQIISHDNRIGASHMLVPGPDGELGFGGHCLPKDTKAFVRYSSKMESPLTILNNAVEYNQKLRKNT